MKKTPILSLKNISTGYSLPGNNKILSQNISAEIIPGTLTFIAGPNGSGKSTLLNTICGFQPPLKGEIHYGKHTLKNLSIKEQAKYRAVVLPHNPETGYLKVKTLIEIGMESEGDLKMEKHLSSIGMTSFIDRTFSTLSDGEKQKVQIVRALCQNPRLLILDEPTAFLDAAARIEILEILKEISSSQNMAVLFSSHDLTSALNATHSCWIISEKGTFHNYASGIISEKELLSYFQK